MNAPNHGVVGGEKVDVLVSDRCFACDRIFRKSDKQYLVDTRDGQEVFVGSDCFKNIVAGGSEGYQPPKGGPKLYVLMDDGQPVTAWRNAVPSRIGGAARAPSRTRLGAGDGHE